MENGSTARTRVASATSCRRPSLPARRRRPIPSRNCHAGSAKTRKAELLQDVIWRRERDSNPRYTFWAYAPLAGECLRPLGHLSDQARDCTFQHLASSNQFLCEIRGLQIAHAKSRLTLPALCGIALNRSKRSLYATLGACSSSKARCSTRTASSRYFSSITTEVLISDVEIIWMLMPSSARLLNILAAMPTCERMPMPTSETLQILLSPMISRAAKPVFFSCSRTSSAFWYSPRLTVKEKSVWPEAPIFCTIMSTSTLAAAIGPRMAYAMPGRSSTPISEILASSRLNAMPDMMACSMVSSSSNVINVPFDVLSESSNDDSTRNLTLYLPANSTERI